ncbi:MAG: GTPase HflX, partial [Candidatus Gracilibacteria bacterium]|nr:GTPase HflX [Candidatus Gracilibacteria bacterium]
MKTIIVDIAPRETKSEDLESRMNELESLVSTYGDTVVVKRIQKRDTPDYNTYVGTGKLEEMIASGEELGAERIIIGNILKPAQIYHINEILRERKSKIQAWDRIDLILKIFDQHAHSPEAKLQIELASIRHMGPRIFGMGMELSRQGGGGSGAMRGLGETNTEIMKRHLRDHELRIIEKLEKYAKTRSEHRKSRKRKDFQTVGIVGYTNAGKSTLMNTLTHKGVLAEDKLFATLGTSVGKMWLAPSQPHINPLPEGDEATPFIREGTSSLLLEQEASHKSPLIEGKNPVNTKSGGVEAGYQGYAYGKEILINDTIGFIRDLPPELIRAFSSTLEDSIEADILLHVIDAHDPKVLEKIDIVETTLSSIGAKQQRI